MSIEPIVNVPTECPVCKKGYMTSPDRVGIACRECRRKAEVERVARL